MQHRCVYVWVPDGEQCCTPPLLRTHLKDPPLHAPTTHQTTTQTGKPAWPLTLEQVAPPPVSWNAALQLGRCSSYSDVAVDIGIASDNWLSFVVATRGDRASNGPSHPTHFVLQQQKRSGAADHRSGSDSLRQAVETLQQAAASSGGFQVEQTTQAAHLVASNLQHLTDRELVSTLSAAAQLLSASSSSSSSSSSNEDLRQALQALLNIAAEQRLPTLSAPHLAALGAVWPAAGDRVNTQTTPPTSSGSAQIMVLLEASLRQRQLPGSWDTAAITRLAQALARHAAQAASSVYLSLAMLTVELASRQRQVGSASSSADDRGAEAAATDQDPPAFAPAQLVTIINAFSAAGHYNQAAFDMLCTEALAQLRLHGYKLASDQQHAQQQGESAPFTTSQLAAFVAACAQARHFDGRLLNAVADAFARCRQDVALEQLAQVCKPRPRCLVRGWDGVELAV